MLIARVAVEKTVYHFDKLYDYVVPDTMNVSVGQRVVVPFAGSHRIGIVVEFTNEKPEGITLKVIISLADAQPILSNEGVVLLKYLKDYTFCTWFDALSVLIPAGFGMRQKIGYSLLKGMEEPEDLIPIEKQVLDYLRHKRVSADVEDISEALNVVRQKLPMKHLEELGLIRSENLVLRKIGDATNKMIRLTTEPSADLTPKQRKATELLEQVGAGSVAEICYFSGVGKSVLDKLVSNGIAEYYEEPIYRDPYENTDRTIEKEEIVLSNLQQDAYDSLLKEYNGSKKTTLLYGITGSGKTLVYMKLVDKVLSEGKSVLMLVPEISLTPQTIKRFHKQYGENIAVIHSGLSLSERLDEWKRIRDKKAKVVVGTRSAVFAPLENLGLIIIDEEQEHTYISEASPRYDAKQVANVRAAYNKAMVVLASATPSVESFYYAKTGIYHLVELKERYGNAVLPKVEIIEMGDTEMIAEGFTENLCEEIKQNLIKNEQSILLVNRRGHSTQVKCTKCQKHMECPNCSIPLKYHSANNRMMCHYCGYSQEVPQKCPSCGSPYIRYDGMGTQKGEEQLKVLFPSARILRMDQDTTLRKLSHQKLLDEFGEGKYDILIGTQMVAKGLDFPKVTLVGILTLDSMLNTDDFRASEHTFSLITQVVGRSGRQKLPGRAILQTYTPENEMLLQAATQNYDAFYQDEIEFRRQNIYPPFCRLYCIAIIGKNENDTIRAAADVAKQLTDLLKTEYADMTIRVLGISQAHIYRLAGRYRYKILVKAKSSKQTRELFHRLLVKTGDYTARGITIYVDPQYINNL